MNENLKDGASVSRRDFLKGAGIAAFAAGGAAALSVSGVAFADEKGESASASASGAGASESDAGGSASAAGKSAPAAGGSVSGSADASGSASVSPEPTIMDRNPNQQVDESVYGTGDMELSMLFSPLTIGKATLKNRIVKSGAGCPVTYDENGFPNEQMLEFYDSIAKGGAGYIIIDHNDMPVEALQEVAERVHQYGAAIGMQRYSMANWMPAQMGGLSSSNTVVSVGSLDFGTPGGTMATTDQVKAVIEDFVSSAERAHDAGFEGFEINAGCNHLLDSFLSRVYNNERTDEYGPQSLENRARIITDIIGGIRDRCGDDLAISVLFNAFEANFDQLGDEEACTHVDEAVEFAKLFEAAGANMLHVRWATHGNHAASFFPDRMFICEPGHTGYGSVVDFRHDGKDVVEYRYEGAAAFAKVAAKIKEAVSIPVGTVGCMDPRLCPDIIETALEEGDIDLVMMTRPLIADPELPNKLESGERDQIAPCTHCESCFMSGPGGCRVNPIFSRAGTDEIPEGYDYIQTDDPKNVMVIGGGPAGMEAARAAAYCGNKVTLYEKTGILGGKMLTAEAIKGKHELLGDYIDYLSRQLEVSGVDVELGTEVTADLVGQVAPDVVIMANGADYITPDYDGFESSGIASDIAGGMAAEGAKVILIGNGVQVLNTAEYLLKKNNQVTIINPSTVADLGQYMPEYLQTPTLNWLHYHGMKDYNGAAVEKIDAAGVTFVTSFGLEVTELADYVLTADEAVDTDFETQIKAVAGDVIVVGDALKPANIIYATKVAHIAGRYLTQPEFPVATAVGFPGGAEGSGSAAGSAMGSAMGSAAGSAMSAAGSAMGSAMGSAAGSAVGSTAASK